MKTLMPNYDTFALQTFFFNKKNIMSKYQMYQI